MKMALVTTTITIPYALELLRRYDKDVRFFIAGDLKSPDHLMLAWMERMDNTVWLSAATQKELGYKCSEIIGWNCIQRRAIAVLEALKWGADIIVSWDTDNYPMDPHYFDNFNVLSIPGYEDFCGLQVSSSTGWYNPYSGFKHRGFPIEKNSAPFVATIVDAPVGVAAGICCGDPDIDAYTRIAVAPHVTPLNLLHGTVVSLDTKTVFNTQNTAYLRQFAPAMFCAPGLGRHDDIFASLLTQKVMRDQGYHVHIGKPFAFQQRHPHNLLEDLKQEIWGMEHILEVSEFLDACPVPRDVKNYPILDVCKEYWKFGLFSAQSREAGFAFLEDCARAQDYSQVMK